MLIVGNPNAWREIADRVFVRHQSDLSLNHGLVLGADRALVIDTGVSAAAGHELLESVERITGGGIEPVVVNTHAHYDHCFGNIAFRDVQIYAHAAAVDHLLDTAEQQRADVIADLRGQGREAEADQVAETEVVLPFYLLEQDAALDLGGRVVELILAGPAHTDHDLLVAVPDVGVVFWGDLIEQGADPSVEDVPAADWASELNRLLLRADISEARHHVPGHGAVVDLSFVRATAQWLAQRPG